MAFMPEEVEKKLHEPLIEYLMKTYNEGASDNYCDIHITTDGYCLIVEWAVVPHDHSYGGTFQFIDEDCTVMREVYLVDGSVESIPDYVDADDYVRERNEEIASESKETVEPDAEGTDE